MKTPIRKFHRENESIFNGVSKLNVHFMVQIINLIIVSARSLFWETQMTPMNFDGEIALGKILSLRSRAYVKILKPGGEFFFSKEKKF